MEGKLRSSVSVSGASSGNVVCRAETEKWVKFSSLGGRENGKFVWGNRSWVERKIKRTDERLCEMSE